jgi:hypothetical protein
MIQEYDKSGTTPSDTRRRSTMETALGEEHKTQCRNEKNIPIWVKHAKELEKAKDTHFERIGITCLKQRILERIGNKNVKGFKLTQDLFKKSIAFFFAENGVYDEIHTDPDKTIIHTIFTDSDSNIDFQEAHTDYDYLPRQIES